MRNSEAGDCEGTGGGPPAGAKQEPDTLSVSGKKWIEPAAFTPGTLRISVTMCSKYSERFRLSSYFDGATEICIVRTCSGSNPGYTATSRAKLRSIRPAPTDSNRASATSVTTK